MHLKPPPYVQQIAHGSMLYPVEDGVLTLPEDVALALLRSHRGYAIAKAPAVDRVTNIGKRKA